MTKPPDHDADDAALHQLFEVLRERVVTVTSDFHTRLQGELDEIDSAPSEGRVSVVRVLLSSLLQASNVVLGAVKPAESDSDSDAPE